MPSIYTLISDTALRDAVTEGLKLAKLGDVHTEADMVAALSGDDIAAIIIDESAADKKNLKAFQGATAESHKKRGFLLGEADTAWTDNIDVESFAKPLRLGHLLTRVAFHFGAQQRKSSAVVFGVWRFEPQNRQMTRQDNGDVIRLTEKETAVLDCLAQSDAPVAREELLAAVWGHDGRIDTHTLETHIYQLRRKMDPEGHLLVNEGGKYGLKGLQINQGLGA